MVSISKPKHKRYALQALDDGAYIKFVNGYSIAKKFGVKSVWIYISSSGVYELCKEVFKGEIRKYGRKKLGVGIVSFLGWVGSPVIPLITNSTKIIKLTNSTHTIITFFVETCEDCTNLAWLPLDVALTGQPIPIGEAGRYNLMRGNEFLFDFFNDIE